MKNSFVTSNRAYVKYFVFMDTYFCVEEYYACQKQLRQAGVTWISIEEPDLDPEDPDAAFKINIYLTMAEYEAKKTSKRIRFNNKMRIKNRQVITGTRCFHFPWMVTGEPRNRHLVKNPDTAEMAMDVIDFYEKHQGLAPTLGYINIKYGMKMTMTTLRKLLKDTLWYGEYKGVPDYVEPYITKERFDRIQDILTRNARASNAPDRTFLFSGLVKCPGCGRNLAGNFQVAKGYECYNYRCNAGRTQKICTFTGGISEKKLEKQLLDNLGEYIGNEIIRVESIEEDRPKNRNAEKVAKLKAELDRLNMMFRKGRIPEEEYDCEYMKIEKQIKKLDVEEVPPKKDLDALKGILESDYKTIYSHLTKENKKAFWRNTIKEFTLDENKKIIPESIIFF